MIRLDFADYPVKNKTFALAVSGGRDSMAMLHLFLNEGERLGIRFFVVNIEHGIRGESSKQDSKFVKEYCKKHNIECKIFEVDTLAAKKDGGGTVEECARALRHDVFKNLLKSGACDAVCLAHNQDDQAETVLMRILRGTGIGGLKGMQKVAKIDAEAGCEEIKGEYIRPLLWASRAEIDNYVTKFNVPYVEDETNVDNAYMRNFLRNEVLPLIETRYKDAKKNLTKIANRAAELENSVVAYVPAFAYEGEGGENCDDEECERENEQNCTSCDMPEKQPFAAIFDCEKLTDPYLSKTAILRAMKGLGAVKDVEETHLEAVFALCQKRNGASLDLPYGITAVKEYDKLVLTRVGSAQNREDVFKNDAKITAPKGIEFDGFSVTSLDAEFVYSAQKVAKSAVKASNMANKQANCANQLEGTSDASDAKQLRFDADKVPAGAVFRKRREGDRFKRFGGGTKSLSDYLTDIKIPKRKRDNLIVLAKESDVYLIAGVEISEHLKIDENTKIVVIETKKCYQKNNTEEGL